MYTKKTIDVWALFKESFKFIIKYKALWVVGFVLALFCVQGGGGGSASANLKGSSDKSGVEVMLEELPGSVQERVSDAVTDWKEVFNSISVIALISSLTCFGLIIAILGFYVRIVARNAIIRAAASGTKLGLLDLWNSGHKGFWNVVLVDIAYGMLQLILVILSIPLICLCGVGILTIIVGSVVLNWVYVTAVRLIVLKDKNVLESINDAWEVVSQNISNYIVFALLVWLLGLIKGVIFFAIFGIGFVIFLITFGVVFAIGFPIISVLAIILLVGIAWIVSAIFNTLFILQEEVFTTKVVKELVE